MIKACFLLGAHTFSELKRYSSGALSVAGRLYTTVSSNIPEPVAKIAKWAAAGTIGHRILYSIEEGPWRDLDKIEELQRHNLESSHTLLHGLDTVKTEPRIIWLERDLCVREYTASHEKLIRSLEELERLSHRVLDLRDPYQRCFDFIDPYQWIFGRRSYKPTNTTLRIESVSKNICAQRTRQEISRRMNLAMISYLNESTITHGSDHRQKAIDILFQAGCLAIIFLKHQDPSFDFAQTIDASAKMEKASLHNYLSTFEQNVNDLPPLHSPSDLEKERTFYALLFTIVHNIGLIYKRQGNPERMPALNNREIKSENRRHLTESAIRAFNLSIKISEKFQVGESALAYCQRGQSSRRVPQGRWMDRLQSCVDDQLRAYQTSPNHPAVKDGYAKSLMDQAGELVNLEELLNEMDPSKQSHFGLCTDTEKKNYLSKDTLPDICKKICEKMIHTKHPFPVDDYQIRQWLEIALKFGVSELNREVLKQQIVSTFTQARNLLKEALRLSPNNVALLNNFAVTQFLLSSHSWNSVVSSLNAIGKSEKIKSLLDALDKLETAQKTKPCDTDLAFNRLSIIRLLTALDSKQFERQLHKEIEDYQPTGNLIELGALCEALFLQAQLLPNKADRTKILDKANTFLCNMESQLSQITNLPEGSEYVVYLDEYTETKQATEKWVKKLKEEEKELRSSF